MISHGRGILGAGQRTDHGGQRPRLRLPRHRPRCQSWPGRVPLVLLQHFRGNLDNWDPALIDALAADRRVVTFDNAGVGGSSGTTPDIIEQMARDAIAFLGAMELSQADLLGFSIGSFVAQQVALIRPAIVRRLVLGVLGSAGRGGHARLGARGHRRGRHAADQPGGLSRRVLHPVGRQPAGGQEALAAHVRPDRGPGHGHNLGDPRGAVRRGLHLGDPRSRAAAAAEQPSRCRYSWPTATATR